MLDWNDLRYFLAVTREGSTLAAGRVLRTSQTTVARRVAALERALGLPLFERRQAGYVLTPAGEELIDPLNDAGGVCHHDVRAGRTEVVHRQTLQDLVRQACGRSQRQLKRRSVGDTRAFHVRWLHVLRVCQHANSFCRTVHDDDADVERPQQSDVEEERCEVVVTDDAAVQREDKGPVAELRHIVQDAP